ncbi:MAG: alpha/beta fold hydrolase [Pseudomonadota bacterium]|nr:alpha/beta fold hydrolase [Pseudomonadota bacterium]MDP1904096.1 alpha/beta fold hydrolase [Pseudomonadota bacterium]MDP2354211.1 alpha/beta fold hydrolase [Pseudomonadota bacterium]
MTLKGVLLLALCWISLAAHATPVELKLSGKLLAKAEYREGAPSKPAVLFLHGFLQTHEFPTIHRLIGGVADSGHTVLAPTLSLGITHRRQSLACEAIHTHTMKDALREIDAWVKWLKARHNGPIILVGHSSGSVEALAYLSGKPDPAIGGFIGISIVEGRIKMNAVETARLIKEMRLAVKTGTPRVTTQQFSFCQKYQATPASLLSYLEWTPQRVLDAAATLAPPNLFIMGGRDDRLGEGWVGELKKRNRVIIIEGANHFMDGEHEFDLLDVILNELNTR